MRRLRIRDAGKVWDVSRERLFVKTLHVAVDQGLERALHVDLYQAPDPFPWTCYQRYVNVIGRSKTVSLSNQLVLRQPKLLAGYLFVIVSLS